LGRENSAFQFESFAQKVIIPVRCLHYVGSLKMLSQMPVKSSYTDTIKPANPAELQKKIIDKENGAQGIVDDVRKEVSRRQLLYHRPSLTISSLGNWAMEAGISLKKKHRM
jgi:hypothetical protein